MKKLIPALCMLLIAACLMGTSTYAWFSMNDRVTAQGMTITAASDAIFLEIKGTEDATFSTEGRNNINDTLRPVSHETWSKLADVTDFDLAQADNYDNWYYRYSDKPSVYNSNLSAKTYISSFADYVAVSTYEVQLRPGSASTAYDLYVSSITIPENKGITVVVAGQTGYKEFTASSGQAGFAFNAADIISDTVTTTAQTISVYIYINGDDANVTTDKASTLTGSVTLSFNAFAKDQNPANPS